MRENFIDFFLPSWLQITATSSSLTLCVPIIRLISNHRDIISFKTTTTTTARGDEEEVYVSYFYIFIYRIKSDKNGSEKVLTMSKNIGINNFLILGKRKGKNSTIITIKKAVTNEIKSLTRRVCVCGCLKKLRPTYKTLYILLLCVNPKGRQQSWS